MSEDLIYLIYFVLIFNLHSKNIISTGQFLRCNFLRDVIMK